MSERIFLPLVDLIKKQGGKIVGGQLVTDVTIDAATGTAAGVHTTTTKDGKKTYYAADAVIFAVGITGHSLLWFVYRLWFVCTSVMLLPLAQQ